jgi:membrane protease subunit HflK
MGGSQAIGELRRDARRALRGARHVVWGAVGVLFLGWLFSGTSCVEANQIGFVRRFGRVVRHGDGRPKVVEPGLTILLPWPIDTLDTVSRKDIRRAQAGFSIKTAPGTTEEPAPGRAPRHPAGVHWPIKDNDIPYCLTGDQNIVHITVVVQYQVKDPYQYLYRTGDPEATLIRAVNEAVITCTARTDVDGILTTEKELLRAATREQAQTVLDELRAGLLIHDLQLEPPPSVPKETERAFQSVVDAKLGIQTARSRAQEAAKRIESKAAGQAARFIAEAEADRLDRVRQAKSDATNFGALLKEYEKDKAITRLRMYLETMEAVIGRVKRYVLPRGRAAIVPRGAVPPALRSPAPITPGPPEAP